MMGLRAIFEDKKYWHADSKFIVGDIIQLRNAKNNYPNCKITKISHEKDGKTVYFLKSLSLKNTLVYWDNGKTVMERLEK